MKQHRYTGSIDVSGHSPEHLAAKRELLSAMSAYLDDVGVEVGPESQATKQAYTIAAALEAPLIEALLRGDLHDHAEILRFWHRLVGDRFYETIEPRGVSLHELVPPRLIPVFHSLSAYFYGLTESERKVLDYLRSLPYGDSKTLQEIATAVSLSHDHVRNELLKPKGTLRQSGLVDKRKSRGFYATRVRTPLEMPQKTGECGTDLA